MHLRHSNNLLLIPSPVHYTAINGLYRIMRAYTKGKSPNPNLITSTITIPSTPGRDVTQYQHRRTNATRTPLTVHILLLFGAAEIHERNAAAYPAPHSSAPNPTTSINQATPKISLLGKPSARSTDPRPKELPTYSPHHGRDQKNIYTPHGPTIITITSNPPLRPHPSHAHNQKQMQFITPSDIHHQIIIHYPLPPFPSAFSPLPGPRPPRNHATPPASNPPAAPKYGKSTKPSSIQLSGSKTS